MRKGKLRKGRQQHLSKRDVYFTLFIDPIVKRELKKELAPKSVPIPLP